MERNKGKLGFQYFYEIIRDGKVIHSGTNGNIITDEGITYSLDAAFSGGTPITTFYIVIFSSNTTPAAGMTYAVPVYTEVTTGVDEAARQQWVEAGVSAKALTSVASKAVYTANTTLTAYGAAIVGGGSAATTKGDTAGGGKLISCGLFDTPRELENDDVINVWASLSMADDGI